MKTFLCKYFKNKSATFSVCTNLNDPEVDTFTRKDPQKKALIRHLLASDPEKFKLVVIYLEKTIVMAYLLESIQINLGEVYKSKEGLWGRFSKHLLNFYNLRIAHPCYSVLYDMDFVIAEESKINDQVKYELILKSLDQLKDELGIHVISIPKGQKCEPALLNVFDDFNYEMPVDDFTMEITLASHWGKFEDYLGELKRKYNKRALSIRKKGSQIKYKELGLSEILEHEPILNSLYNQVVDGQKFIAEKALKNHFSTLKSIFNEEFILEAGFLDNEIVSFLTYFRKPDHLHIHYVGLNYSKNNEFDLYFNLLFRTIELGIASNVNRINYGRTSLDAKASLGAIPVKHYTFVRTHCLTKLIKKAAINQIKKLENSSWKQRLPFKSDVSVLEEV